MPRCVKTVNQMDATLPVYDLKTLEAQLDETLLSERLIALLSAGFGLLATLLAAIGLYGVMAFVVARRTKELGVRIARRAPRPHTADPRSCPARASNGVAVSSIGEHA